MQRRHFIGFIAGLMPGLATASTRPAAQPQDILIQRSPIAGFQYHQGEAVWQQLAIGEALTLHREPDNRYDRRAVRVEWQGHKLGYVPRRDNAAVAQMLDRGQPLTARINTMQQHSDPWRRIELEIHISPTASLPSRTTAS